MRTCWRLAVVHTPIVPVDAVGAFPSLVSWSIGTCNASVWTLTPSVALTPAAMAGRPVPDHPAWSPWNGRRLPEVEHRAQVDVEPLGALAQRTP